MSYTLSDSTSSLPSKSPLSIRPASGTCHPKARLIVTQVSVGRFSVAVRANRRDGPQFLGHVTGDGTRWDAFNITHSAIARFETKQDAVKQILALPHSRALIERLNRCVG